ncbi:MAG: hypothetical protein CMO81_00820 [Waddliaceae bacterium]|nr:hypothetical protein [Waddliaceae bacterium]
MEVQTKQNSNHPENNTIFQNTEEYNRFNISNYIPNYSTCLNTCYDLGSLCRLICDDELIEECKRISVILSSVCILSIPVAAYVIAMTYSNSKTREIMTTISLLSTTLIGTGSSLSLSSSGVLVKLEQCKDEEENSDIIDI